MRKYIITIYYFLFLYVLQVYSKRYAFIKKGIPGIPKNYFKGFKLYNSKEMKNYCETSRVVCTGVGVVTGVGIGIEKFWKNIINGYTSIDKITKFDVTGMSCGIGSEIKKSDFNASDYYTNKKDVNRNDDCTHYAVAATRLALDDAKLNLEKLDKDKTGTIIGSGIGGLSFLEKEMKTMYEKGHKRITPYLIPAMIANTPSGYVSIENNIRGISLGMLSACATSGNTIGEAYRYIKYKEYDVMICGGTEASITPISFAGFNSLKALCTGYNDNPKKGCRPFDLKRSGFVMGEGSGILILESYEHAIKRNAPIYGEIISYASESDAYHITAPEPNGRGLINSIHKVLKNANINTNDVKYINAHGTSTHLNDKIETKVFKNVFKDHAYKLYISSTKSMTGHCIGAAGAIESIVCLKTMQTNIIPPTINYENKDPDCDLNYTPNKYIHAKQNIDISLNTNLGFGGHNTALLFKKIVK
ncbi:3-oxoacyl-acyl-carrier protein synthase I/II [Plasmodium sp. gorilla clade G2]|uniref:3-oxoacyl-acyl-carrier protein synthase I/II n=1 Tax=Plasmodium sp. gorilla clade G2 TaxID=880535 RepID=UPI000D22469E|nr:3-oxoacyl-acyl-carrier protein synthase I/II [Plasmodium sp. gorilla clade G2]SOV12672.1 3-oxoacyl-acyl-carrier protein synthase I/II [Plasmodium sp. gorilla clade G2]